LTTLVLKTKTKKNRHQFAIFGIRWLFSLFELF